MNKKRKIIALRLLHFTEVITKIISHLSETRGGQSNKSYYHIDIELIKGDKHCSIRITNCGVIVSFLEQFLTLKFDEIPKEISSLVIVKEADGDSVKIYETWFNGDFRELRAEPNAILINKLAHLKEYLSLEPRCKLMTREIPDFIERVKAKLLHLVSINPQIKYTFSSENEKFFNNPVDLDNDYIHCESLSSSISDVLKQSINEDFRKKAFDLLEIESAEEASNATMQRLLPLINKNYHL